MKVKILSFALMIAIFGGCSFNGFMGEPTSTSNRNVVIQKVDKDDLREVMKKEKMIYDSAPRETTFRATGEGIAPLNSLSYAQSVTLAKEQRWLMLIRSLQASFTV